MNPQCNIEIKARCGELDGARAAAEKLGAHPGGFLDQTDTYYRAAHGRLKLREINSERAELIWYVRPDDADARSSDYHVAPIALENVPGVKAALAAAVGVRGIVRKRRELWRWHNVRIHLDTVESLGTFIEFEAVIGPDAGEDESTAHARLAELCRAMNVRDDDRLAQSYSDLLEL